METAAAILRFWFGDGADAEVARRQAKLWWGKDPQLDADIRRRFEDLPEAERRGELEAWGRDADAWLARILVLDQFPRNMHRETARAFAYDERARLLAHEALARGLDRALPALRRVFVYMPLEHSEDRHDQAISVQAFTTLRDQAADPDRALFQDFLDFAVKHRDIIERFGRFPHRNAILGRASRPDELEFLQGPGSSF